MLFPADGPYQVRLTRKAQTDAFELHKAIDEQMSHAEKLRLLYVACTRARDHLVVSVHRGDREVPHEATKRTAAELLWEAATGCDAIVAAPQPSALPPTAGVPAPPVLDLDAWLAEHDPPSPTGARPLFLVP